MWNQQDGMVGLGQFPDGHVADAANDISADGTVIVGNGGCGGFVWMQNTGIMPFCSLPGAPEATSLNRVSDDNSFFIGTTNAGGFVYSIAGGVGLLPES